MNQQDLRSTIQQDIKQSMLQRDSLKLETLRFVWSEIKNLEIDLKHELVDDEILNVLKREVKKRKDAIEQFRKGGRQDLVEEEAPKVEIIAKYLPEQVSETEISAVIEASMNEANQDFGSLMREVMGKLNGQADGSVVSRLVRQALEK
jgi:uncharacterized protein